MIANDATVSSVSTDDSPPRYCLEMNNISKRFGGAQALDDVSIRIQPGQVLALCGANGAGKSTLVRILAGVERADEGVIVMNGREVQINVPRDASKLGLSFVHQELNLVPKFSALQNIAMGAHHPGRMGIINRRSLRRRASEVQDRLGCRIPLDARAEDLSVSDRWMVSLVRSLMRDASIVAMDEPTASFNQEEADRLYAVIDELKNQGVGILYISHRLEEVLQVCDEVTVLRDGRVEVSCATGTLSVATLTRHIVGRDLENLSHRQVEGDPTRGPEVLTVRGLTREPSVRGASLTVHRGEILGIAGLVGAGRTELARLLAGADTPSTGSLELAGSPYSPRSSRDGLRAGVALVPEERRSQGLVLHGSIASNIAMASRSNSGKRLGAFSPRRELAVARGAVKRFGIKVDSVKQPVAELSGGNQQKVVLSKYILTNPQLLILDEPTVGVDVGARDDIYTIIRELAASGTSVVMISSDFDELVMCDRVLVMRQGVIVEEVPTERVSKDYLTTLCFGLPEDSQHSLQETS